MSTDDPSAYEWSSQPTRSVASVLTAYGDNELTPRQVNSKCVELCSKVLDKLSNFVAGAPLRANSAASSLKSKTTVRLIVHL